MPAVSVHGDFPPKIRWNFGGLDNSQLYIDVLVSLPLSLFYAHVIGTYIGVTHLSPHPGKLLAPKILICKTSDNFFLALQDVRCLYKEINFSTVLDKKRNLGIRYCFYLSSNDDIVEIFTMWPAYNLQYNFTAMDENIRQEMVHADEERELYKWNGWNRKNEWNGMEFDGIEFMRREGRKEKEIHTIKIRKERKEKGDPEQR